MIWQDLRYAFRILARNRGFTAIIVATLGLATAANVAVFSVVSAIFLRPLPGIADPSRLVSLYRIQSGQTFDNASYPDYRDYRDRNHSLAGLAAHSSTALSLVYGAAERITGDLVTENYFSLLDVHPAAGRLLDAGENPVAVISYRLWQRRFGGGPQAIGARILVNGYPFTVIGVAPDGFQGARVSIPVDFWAPLGLQPLLMPRLSNNVLENRASGWLQVFGRLKPGVSVGQADAEVRMIAAQLAEAYPVTNGKRTVGLAAGAGIYPDERAEIQGLLALLSITVALLMSIACSNAAGMLLLRAAGRTREIAIRMAAGASRWRIIRQLLAEGFVLASTAAIFGVTLVTWSMQAIVTSSQGTAPSLIRHAGVRTDGNVLAFALLTTAATGMLVALPGVTHFRKLDLSQSLKSGSPGAGFRGTRVRSLLVAGQVALSLVLAGGAGLLLSGLYRIVTASPGFDASHVAMGTVDLSLQRYTETRGQSFYRDVLAGLRKMPGVISATLATTVPPTEWPGATSIFHPGEEPLRDRLQGNEFELGTRVNINRVFPEYFRTLQIPILQGRDFTDHDRSGEPGVVIVCQKLASKMWPGENAVGKQIVYPSWEGPRRPAFTVIGVAADVRHIAVTREAPLLLYVPALEEYSPVIRVVTRTAYGAGTGIAFIRQAVAAVDSSVAVYQSQTGSEHLSDSLWQQRMAAAWIGAFGVMALSLAGIGLYAVIAQSVMMRRREVGIRMALGADRFSVAALVVRQGMVLTGAGLAVGLPAAWAFLQLVKGRLEGVAGASPWTLIPVAGLIGLVMLAACWMPARRAASIDPIECLRCD